MKKTLLFFVVIGLLSCDDGDINVPDFNFTTTEVEYCGELLLYNVNELESLTINLSSTDNKEREFFLQERSNQVFPLTTSGTNTITYRTFNESPSSNYFCQNVPPTSPTVINEWTGEGELVVTTTLTIDDQDGVPAEDEDINGDDDPTNDDSDEDTIPDYIDFDDDGDGIETSKEDLDGDGDFTNDDTDGDGIPNYLDDDDDGDGVDTSFEAETDEDLDGTPDYLDPDPSVQLTEERILTNQYEKSYQSQFTINFLQLTNDSASTINFDTYDFGLITETRTKVGSEDETR